jgi:WD40 repeat protein/serine/threonine protein kinase
MSDPIPRENANLLRLVDRACDCFEAAWKAGGRPRIEDHLDEAAGPERAALLRELVPLDVSYRQREGQEPTPEEYRRRFPEHVEVIDAAFATIPPGNPEEVRTRPVGAKTGADDNLLFGILALQLDFVSRDALIAAMHAWILQKAKPLGRILVEQGALAEARHALLEALVKEHLKQHGDDARQSLAALSPIGPVRQDLEQVADPEVTVGLAHVSAAHTADDPYATATPAVGQPTSAGQRFVILRPHAKGGLGVVSVARDQELNREVALKEIQDRHADRPESRARFMREAAITGGLEHPGIVPVYGLGQYADGRPFYAMRFVQGNSLKDEIKRFHEADFTGRDPGVRALALRELLGRFLDVCNAIAYAHSRGVLHRDLKPGNIMVGKYGETLVVDWGLAKTTDRPDLGKDTEEKPLVLASVGGVAETQAGRALGTPAYMSPEQASGELDRLGQASDVYSLGATLYHLLTGHAPVEEPDTGRALQRVRRGEIAPPRQVDRRIAPGLDAICRKAMALKPEDRYATSKALADDIEHWLADEPVLAFPEGWSQRLSRWSRRNRTWVLAGAAALLLVTVVSLGATMAIRRSLHETHTSLARLALDRGMNLCEQGNVRDGILWLAHSLRITPADDADLQHLIRVSLGGWGRQFRGLRGSLEHRGSITAVAFSPDGKTILTGSKDGTARLWDVATSKPVGVSLNHKSSVTAVAFGYDGKTILTGSEDHTVWRWNIAEKKSINLPVLSLDYGTAMTFSPDGKAVLTRNLLNGTFQLWDVTTAKSVASSMQYQKAVNAAAFSPDNKLILTGSLDKLAKLWDAATAKSVGSPFQHEDWVTAVTFSPDSKIVATGCKDGTVRLWDPSTAKRIDQITQPSWVTAVAFSPDGKTILTGSLDKTARLWDVASAKPVSAPLNHESGITVVAFSPNGKTILTGTFDGTVRIWDADTVKSVGESQMKNQRLSDTTVAFVPFDEPFVPGSDTTPLGDMFRAIPTTSPLTFIQLGNKVAFSPDSKIFLTLNDGNDKAQLWNLASSTPIGSPLNCLDFFTAEAFSPDGKTVVTCSFLGTVQLWDVVTAKPVGLPVGYQLSPVYAVAFSPDSKAILTASNDNTARVWDVVTGKPISAPLKLRSGATAVAFSPTARTVLIGCDDGTSQFWDVATAKPVGALLNHQSSVTALTFNPNGKMILTGSWDGTVRLWDVFTGRPVGAPMRHKYWVTSVVFGLDGRIVLTGSFDGTAQLWDTVTAEPIGAPLIHPGWVNAVAFSSDGKSILTGGDGDVRLWDVPTPVQGDGKRIVLWSQVITGRKLNDRDGIDVLVPDTVFELRQELEKLGGPPLQ